MRYINMKKNKIIIAIAVIITGLLIVLMFRFLQTAVLTYQQNGLNRGESITYFDIVDEYNQKTDANELNSHRLVLLFIFQQRNSLCDKNIALWNRIGKILGHSRVIIYGIIPEEFLKLSDMKKNSNLNFDLYTPKNIEKFKKALGIKDNLSQTIFYLENRVEFIKSGELEDTDYTRLMSTINHLIYKEFQLWLSK